MDIGSAAGAVGTGRFPAVEEMSARCYLVHSAASPFSMTLIYMAVVAALYSLKALSSAAAAGRWPLVLVASVAMNRPSTGRPVTPAVERPPTIETRPAAATGFFTVWTVRAAVLPRLFPVGEPTTAAARGHSIDTANLLQHMYK